MSAKTRLAADLVQELVAKALVDEQRLVAGSDPLHQTANRRQRGDGVIVPVEKEAGPTVLKGPAA